MRASRRLVDEQPRRPVDVADDDVDVAVVVDVAERGAAADLGEGEGGARLARDVLEPAVAEIAEQELALIVGKRLLLRRGP